ncbi:hypothetical protein AALA13_08455 [Lachnospiraceae bacterium 50-23]
MLEIKKLTKGGQVHGMGCEPEESVTCHPDYGLDCSPDGYCPPDDGLDCNPVAQ